MEPSLFISLPDNGDEEIVQVNICPLQTENLINPAAGVSSVSRMV